MLVKVFSLKFDALTGNFDDAPVREFTQDKEVLQVRDHLFIRNEIPYLILVVRYYPYRKEAAVGTSSSPSKSSDEWKKEMSEADLPLFNQLRDWRSQRCKKEGVPPYLIFTNQQLAQIAKTKPQYLTDLAKVSGVGKGKVDRYGEDVLSITKVKSDGG